MNFQEAIELINTSRGIGQKNNLDRMKALLDKIGHPERDLSFIHIAGTNGKGSTGSLIYHVLRQTPKKIGIYTSPHLERLHERIVVNDEMISTEDLIRLSTYLEDFVYEVEESRGEKMYSFEILTALAFLYFAEQKVELVVLETGIGGRFDATNVIPAPLLSVITIVGNDHMDDLGSSLEEIAWHKAGILKEASQAVIYPMENSVMDIFNKVGQEVGAKLHYPDFSSIKKIEGGLDGQRFSYQSFEDIEISLIGDHQIYNAVLALEALLLLRKQGIKMSDQQIYQGLKETKWPGRMEIIYKNPLLILDGSHNRQGVESLEKNLRHLFDPDQKFTLIFGMMRDKESQLMIEKMRPLANKMLVLSPDWERGIDPLALSKEFSTQETPAYPLEGIEDILDYVLNHTEKEEVIVLFGSLYLVGDVRRLFNEKALII